MDATKTRARGRTTITTERGTFDLPDEPERDTEHGCQNCGKHIPISERRRLRMVEHDVEPELCLSCQSDRQVKRQVGGVYTLRHEGLNRAQRRQIARERA